MTDESVFIGEAWEDGRRINQVVHDDRSGAEEDIAVLAGFDGRDGLAWEMDGEGRTEAERDNVTLHVTERHVFTGSPDKPPESAEAEP